MIEVTLTVSQSPDHAANVTMISIAALVIYRIGQGT
jgi:hypothetical protein